MPLSEALIQSALLGTMRQPLTAIQDETFSALKDYSPEAQLLIGAASSNLREQAGYVAGRDGRPLPERCAEDTTILCGDEAASYLRLMAAGKHTHALREWLLAAGAAHLHVPVDVLPSLLLLGQKREELRPYLRPVMGQRGHWLANQITNQNWKWLHDTSEISLSDALAAGWLDEEKLLEVISKSNLYYDNEAQRILWKHRTSWSSVLTSAFLDRIAGTQAPQWGYAYQYWGSRLAATIAPLVYFFPMDMRAEIVRRTDALEVFSQEHRTICIETMNVIFDFRQNMLNAIATSEE